MKKVLLIVGVVCLIAAALVLAFAVLNLFGYHTVLDGSNELYQRLHQRAVVSFIVGIIFAALGAVSLILRVKQ